MSDRVWILGAPDPEMEMIEELLRDCGEEYIYALDADGERVHQGNAYRCPVPAVPEGSTVYAVECIDTLPEGWVRVDHHRPGDPGYGRPPEDFMAASSIGQVISVLRHHGPAFFEAGEWITCDGGEHRDVGGFVIGMPYADTIPNEMVLAAAADHCLAHAYRGECPGVDPDALMQWRAETRAAHQGRSVDDVLADIALARRALQEAPIVDCDFNVEGWCDGCGPNCMFCPRCGTFECGANLECPPDYYMCVGVLDLRDYEVPELPEAASREGVAYLATVVDRDGREKVVLGGLTTPEMVREFMEQWAPAEGLVDIYGDPARGFAGGYLGGGK